MAEKGAHITTTTRTQKNVPSIFDALATDSLNSYEAVKKIFNVLCQDKRLSRLSTYFTEIYFCCNGVIQSYFLKKHAASFAEFFYGLQRKNNKTNTFEKKDYYTSLLTLILLPYVHHKVKTAVEDLDFQQQNNYRHFLSVYKNLTSLFEAAKLIQYLGFFSRQTSNSLLMHQLCNLRLECVEPEIGSPESSSFVKTLNSLFFEALGLSAFFIQFIQSFQTELQYKQTENLVSPGIHSSKVISNETCPICLQKFANPTVVQVSNIVYCYKCINLHFKNKGNYCPSTFLAASITDLITLYEEDV